MPITPPDLTDVTIHEFIGRDHASPVDSLSVTEPLTSTRRFLVTPWADRLEAAKSFLGQVAVDETNNRYERLLPAVHPKYSRLNCVRLTIRGHAEPSFETVAVEVNGTTQDFDIATYKSAVFECSYEHPKHKLLTDEEMGYGVGGTPLKEYKRYVSADDPQPSAEYLQIPGSTLHYTRAGGGSPPHKVPINYGPGKILVNEEITYWHHRIPESVYSLTEETDYQKRIYGSTDGTIKPMIGTVNKTAIFGRAAGTLLFTAFKPVRCESPIGDSWEWRFGHTFNFNPRGHNKLYYHRVPAGFYHVSLTATYAAAGSVADGDSLYNETEHADLYKPKLG